MKMSIDRISVALVEMPMFARGLLPHKTRFNSFSCLSSSFSHYYRRHSSASMAFPALPALPLATKAIFRLPDCPPKAAGA